MALDTAPTEGTHISPTEWAARTATIRDALAEDLLPDTALIATLGSFRFRDDQQRLWSYTGATWWVWDSQQWAEMTPPATLTLDAFKYSATAKFARVTLPIAAAASNSFGAEAGTQGATDGGTSEASAMDASAMTEAATLATAAATEADAVSDQAAIESSAAIEAASEPSAG